MSTGHYFGIEWNIYERLLVYTSNTIFLSKIFDTQIAMLFVDVAGNIDLQQSLEGKNDASKTLALKHGIQNVYQGA